MDGFLIGYVLSRDIKMANLINISQHIIKGIERTIVTQQFFGAY
jgi:hypothetical protein